MKVFSPSPPMADAARDFKGPAEIVFTRMPYLSHTAWGTQVSKTYALYIRRLAQSKMSSKDKSPMCRQRHLRPALETGQNMNREECIYSNRNISQHIATYRNITQGPRRPVCECLTRAAPFHVHNNYCSVWELSFLEYVYGIRRWCPRLYENM